DAGKANVAGLHVGGGFDVFGQGTLDSFSRLQYAGGFPYARGKKKLVIGPWGHGDNKTGCKPPPSCPSSTGTAAGVLPGGPYDAAWQKAVLQDDWTDWNNLPAVKVYLMGPSPGSAWVNYTTWPPAAVEAVYCFTVTNGIGGLSGSPPRS